MSGLSGLNSLNCTYTELRLNIDDLTYKDWFFISLVRKVNKDFIRLFKDNINLLAFIHRMDLDKNFFYEIVGKKDTENLWEFIINNHGRFCNFVTLILELNRELFTEEQLLEIIKSSLELEIEY